MHARGLLAVLASGVLASGCTGEPATGLAVEQLTASPLPEPVRQPEPLARTPAPAASPTPPPPVVSRSSPSPTGPSEADKARFAARYAPSGSHGLQHVALDLDADGTEELLFTYVRDGRSQVDVAAWDGAAYRIVAGATGGEAQRVDRVRVGDLNMDGRTEIVTFEVDDSGASLTVLAVAAVDRLVGLAAVGGCYDGSATYGVVGAELRDSDGDAVPEIVARCDDSPLPVNAWAEETYRWVDGAYRAVEDVSLPSPDAGDG